MQDWGRDVAASYYAAGMIIIFLLKDLGRVMVGRPALDIVVYEGLYSRILSPI